jgi:anhydro-N-acetylmuramic acid kinase
VARSARRGAPLVPWVDRALFAQPDRTRVLLNIGGIANLTRVPRRDSAERLLAFDTGPGNGLIDAAVELATGGEESFDRDGVRAAGGAIDGVLLERLLDDDYLRRPPPRSTGRERYGRPLVERIVAELAPAHERSWMSIVATLTAFTARTIADALREHVLPLGVDELIVTGGGARNPSLMRMLRERLPGVAFVDAKELGVDPDAKEALAFAVLAWAHARGVPANEPEATGARGPRVLGSYTPGARSNP